MSNKHEQPDMTNESPEGDAALLVAVRQELDRSCSALDGPTLSRLHRIRVAAVAKRRSGLPRLFVPFGGLMTACALVVAVSLTWNGGWNARKAETGTPAAMEDMEILASDEALDLYADYEFYQWLAQD